jgi:hypothetical protein
MEMTMISTRLLPLLGGIALLAAAPAFAQSDTKPADTGAAGATNTPAQQEPATHPMHHAMRQAMRSGRTDTSQDSAVDQLNNQSYQAAQQGQSFTAPTGDMGTQSGSPAMHGAGASGKM